MRTITALLLFLLSAANVYAEALQQAPAGDLMMPLPPPPGPYISSRPVLPPYGGPQQHYGQAPMGNLSPQRAMRGPYWQAPPQMPAPTQWWYGPMRR